MDGQLRKSQHGRHRRNRKPRQANSNTTHTTMNHFTAVLVSPCLVTYFSRDYDVEEAAKYPVLVLVL